MTEPTPISTGGNQPMPRMEPLSLDDPDVAALFTESTYGWLEDWPANSVRIMARRPDLLRGFSALASANWGSESEVPFGLKRLVGLVASKVQGCRYCMAHNAGAALKFDIDERKLEAVWDYSTSDLFTDAERVALEFAVAAASQPNAVTDELFAELRRHWSESQICEILYIVCVFGFMNRWNDSLATPLEGEAIAAGQQYLARVGWTQEG